MVLEFSASIPEKPKVLALGDRLKQTGQPLNLASLGVEAKRVLPSAARERSKAGLKVHDGDDWLTMVRRELYGNAALTSEQRGFAAVLAGSLEAQLGSIGAYLPPKGEEPGLALNINWETGSLAGFAMSREYKGPLVAERSLSVAPPAKPQDKMTLVGLGFDAGALPAKVFAGEKLTITLPKGTSFTGQLAAACGKAYPDCSPALQNWILTVASMVDSQLPRGESLDNTPAGTSFEIDLKEGSVTREMPIFATRDQTSALEIKKDLALDLKHLKEKEEVILTDSLERRGELLNELASSDPTLYQVLQATNPGGASGPQAIAALLKDPDTLGEVNARLPGREQIGPGESTPASNRALSQILLERSLNQVQENIAARERIGNENAALAQAETQLGQDDESNGTN